MKNDAGPKTTYRIETLPEVLGKPLENEGAVLDTLVTALGKGQAYPEFWERLHDAALRDDRLAELAFAYEKVIGDRRVKLIPPAHQAQLHLNMASFFADSFSDLDGAIAALGRALAVVPGHPDAFERLARMLKNAKRNDALVDLHVSMAHPKAERETQLTHLRRAIELSAHGDAEKTIRVAQLLLKLEPSDPQAITVAQNRLTEAGRHAEVAKMLEQALLHPSGFEPDDVLRTHGDLIEIYDTELKEVEKALPHVEEVLTQNPTDEVARRVATRLLGQKALAPRAAAALEKVHAAEGDHVGVARMLTIQVEQIRGPKRAEALRRLGELQEETGETEPAFTSFGEVIVIDPSDDVARSRYVTLGAQLDKRQDVQKTLARVAASARDPIVRGKVNVALGALTFELGDERRARGLLEAALPTEDDHVKLEAALVLERIYGEEKDAKALASVLEIVARLDEVIDNQVAALRRLAALYEERFADKKSAGVTLRRLNEIAPSREVSAEIERLLEASESYAELSEVLETRARLAKGPEAKALHLRVAELKTKAGDADGAIEALEGLRRDDGPSLEIAELLIPLFEAKRDTPRLALALEEAAGLAPAEARNAYFTKLARIRFAEADVARAFEIVREIVASGAMNAELLERVTALTKDPEHGEAAVSILLPIHRANGETKLVLELLERLGRRAADVDTRLAALLEGIETGALSADAALSWGQRGLVLALDEQPEAVDEWLPRLLTLGREAKPEALSVALVDVLVGREIADAETAKVARAAAETFVEAGDSRGALETYRALLAYEPANAEIIARVDSLLEEQGSPEDRVELLEASLLRSTEIPRRRELYHKIGAILRRDLKDARGALAIYKRALTEFPDDKAFRGAMYASYESAEAWDELYTELSLASSDTPSDERAAHELRLGQVSLAGGHERRALGHFAELLSNPTSAELLQPLLATVERLAVTLDDTTTLRTIAERRVRGERDEAEIDALEALATIDIERVQDRTRAAIGLSNAATIAEELGLHARSLALLDRARSLRDGEADKETLRMTLRLAQALGVGERQSEAGRELLTKEADPRILSDLALGLETVERAARGDEAYLTLLAATSDRLIATDPLGGIDLDLRRISLLEEMDRAADASALFRALFARIPIDDPSMARVLADFENFLVAHEDDVAGRRLFFELAAKRSTGVERRLTLIGWARAELDGMGDLEVACRLADELRVETPDDIEILKLGAEVHERAKHDTESAQLLEHLARVSDGDTRSEALRVLARLHRRTGNPARAAEVATTLLEADASDEQARQLLLEMVADSSIGEDAQSVALRALETAADDLPAASRAALYERLLQACTAGGVTSPDLFEKLIATADDDERAMDLSLRAAASLPDRSEFWDRAEELAKKLDAPQRLGDQYRALLTKAAENADPTIALAIGERAVDFQEEWFDDIDAVTTMLQKIVDAAPSATWAFERLKLIYNAHERWSDLFTLYDRSVAATADLDEKATTLEDAAEVAKDLAGDPDRAIHYLAALLVIRPGDAKVEQQLERLYERRDKFDAHVALLEARLARSLPEEEERPTLLRIGELWLKVGDHGKAHGHLAKLAKLAPEDVAVRRVLEEILEKEGVAERSVFPIDTVAQSLAGLPETGPDIEPVGARVARTLREIAIATKDATRTSRLLEIELSLATERDSARALIDLLATELDARSDVRSHEIRALSTLLAVDLDAVLADAASSAIDRGAEIVSARALSTVSDAERDDLRAGRILEAAGTLAEADRSLSITIELRLLSRSRDPVRALTAAKELDKMLANEGREAERCDVLEQLARLETTPEAREARLWEVARLAQGGLADPKRAIRALTQIRKVNPADEEALTSLVDLVRGHGDAETLVTLLDARAGLSSRSSSEVARDRLERARLLARLGSDAEARMDFSRVAASEPELMDVGDVDALADLIDRAGDAIALTEHLARFAADAKDAERSASLFTRLGLVAERSLDHPAAFEGYKNALLRLPGNADTLGALEALVSTLAKEHDRDAPPEPSPLFSRAARVLSNAHQDLGNATKVVELAELRLKAAADSAERVDVLLYVADAREREGRPDQALESMLAAFEIAPGDAVVATRLQALANTTDRWDLVAPHLPQPFASESSVPVELRRDILVDAARGLSSPEHSEKAERILRVAHDLAPTHVDILAMLADLLRAAPNAKTVDVLLALARAMPNDRARRSDAPLSRRPSEAPARFDASPGAEVEILREASTICLRELGDEARGHEIAREALASIQSLGPSASEDPRTLDVARWSLDLLTLVAEGDREASFELASAAANLPLPDDEVDEWSYRAIQVAPPGEAITLAKALFAKHPENDAVADDLETRLSAEDRQRELLEVRLARIDAADEPRSRGFRLTAAGLAAVLGEAELAVRLLSANLDGGEAHAESFRRLLIVLHESGKAIELCDALEKEATRRADAKEADAVALWIRASQLREEKGDLLHATDDQRNAAALSDDIEVLDRYASLLDKIGEPLLAVGVLEQIIARTPEETYVLRLFESLTKGDQTIRAAEFLETHVNRTFETSSEPLRAALRTAYRNTQAFDKLASMLSREASLVPDPKARLARLKEAATLLMAELGQHEVAATLLEQAIALDKTDLGARLLMADAQRAQGRPEAAQAILESLLEEYGSRRPKERALVHLELAKVALTLGDRTKAMTELDAGGKIDQSHPEILRTLGRLALQEGQLLRAQRTYRALLLVLRGNKGAREDGISQAEVFLELALIAEKQKEADRRREFVESAFEAAEKSPYEREQLVQNLRAKRWFDLVARALEKQLESVTDLEERSVALGELALVNAELGNDDAALTLALSSVEANPRSQEAHERVGTLARKTERLDLYLDLLRKLGEQHGEERLGLTLVMLEARIVEDELGDDARADAVYGRILERMEALSDSTDLVPTLRRRAAVQRRLDAKSALRPTLERLIAISSEAQEPWESSASDVYELASLSLDGDTYDEALALLERAVDLDGDRARVELNLRRAIANRKEERLARLFEDFARKEQRASLLLDALMLLASVDSEPMGYLKEALAIATESSPERVVPILEEIVQAGDRRGDASEVAEALVALAQARLAAGQYREACELLQRAAPISQPDDERRLLLQIAGILSTNLDSPRQAVEILEGLRRKDPADREAWAPLAIIYAKAGDREALGLLIEETMPLVDDAAMRANLRVPFAEMIADEDPTRAIDLLSETLDEDPRNERAATLLSTLLANSGDHARLARVVERKLDVAKDAEDKARIVALSLELGVLKEELGDEDGALDVYHAALDWEPNARDALRAVVRLGMKRDDSIAVGDMLDRLLAVEEGDQATELAMRVAEMKRAMRDEYGAERALFAGFRANPHSAELKQALLVIYDARGSLSDRAELLAVEASGLVGAEKRAMLIQAAEIFKSEGRAPDRAALLYEQAFAIDASDRDLLFLLMDLLANLGEHRRAIGAVDLAVEADRTGDPSWLYFSRAVLREALGESDEALDDLEAAHRLSNGRYNAELRAHLESALGRMAQLGSRVPEGRRGEAELRVRLAEVIAESGDVDAARRIVAELLRRDPNDKRALYANATFDERTGDVESAFATYSRLAAIEDGPALVPAAIRLGDAAMRMGRPGDAVDALERAIHVDGNDAELKQLTFEVLRAAGEHRKLSGFALAEARTQATPEAVYRGLLIAARLLLDAPDGATDAVTILEEAREMDPNDPNLMLLFADAYSLGGRVDDARKIIGLVIASQKVKRSPLLSRAHYGLHKVEARDGNLSDALAALGKAFDSEPHNAALALELGALALDLDDNDIAQRAYRAVTLMRPGEGETMRVRDRAFAYAQLGKIAISQGDRRRAKLMLDKALADDPELEEARTLLGELGA